MGKNRRRAVDAPATCKVIGVLADESVISTVKVADQHMRMDDAISTIAHDLQTHIDSTFSLRNGININTNTVSIPG